MKRLLILLALAAVLPACKSVSSFVHDGEVVAKAGKHKLYAAELEDFIPGGISAEDSTRLAAQYIDKWATDMLFMDMAETELSKGEKDVSREIESYRRSLLKYRYEQKYVNQRLDTAVTEADIEKYYQDHPDHFKLVRPIVKARYARISGKVGVCMVTSGPGATNLITALATCYADSIPIIAISGQVSSELLPFMLHGTGDLYASSLLAAIMAGKSLYDAVDFAGGFVRDAMRITQAQPDFEVRGVSFESRLSEVAALLG